MHPPHLRRALGLAVAATLIAAAPSPAWNSVTNTNGDAWNVNDAAIPGLDTGSIHNTTTNGLQGYGGIRMDVNGGSDRMNGVLLRGFGLKYDGTTRFASQNAPGTDGVTVQRKLLINRSDNWARFLDSFTNQTKTTVTVEVAFGGQLGYNTGSNQSTIASTSSGDTAITGADGWVSYYTPSAGAGSGSFNGPSATVIGTPGFAGTLNRTGTFLRDPFNTPLATTGDEANHPAFVNRLVIPAKSTRSLVHFVVTGLSETRALTTGAPIPAAGTQVTAVQTTAQSLSTNPPMGDLTPGETCTVQNINLTTVAGFDPAACPASQGEPLQGGVVGASTMPAVTTSPYDVVGKSISDLVADMKAGKTTSAQITRAYLDRIAVYDRGPFGLHAVIALAPDAMAQAKAADAARKAGDTRPLLGIPILAKDIFDTKDMPTTGASLVFDGYRPTDDAWQVAKARESGAIILGKANLAEFANDGHFSPSAYGQVWNAFDPSRSPIGSSGGSAVAVASSFAAAAFGTQTGDSLWGPSSAASLVSLRGTDGMQSADGVMPLTYIQDYAGVIAKTLPDLAVMLNAVAKGNPNDPRDDISDGKRPADWTTALKENALQGKVIGVPATGFNDPFKTTGTSTAMRAQFARFTEAGATVKDIPDAPAAPTTTSGDRNYEGWRRWILAHPNNPYTEVPQIIRSALRLPQFRNTAPYTGTGPMTEAEIKAFENYRANYRSILAKWMDDQGVDAVLFAGELSDIHLNDSIQPSFGRIDPQSSAAGVPTVIFPAGVNDHGQPINLQLQGRAFSDLDLMGYAYAFEAKAKGQVLPTTTPRLTYQPGVEPIEPAATVTPAPAPVTTPAPGSPAPIPEGAPPAPSTPTPATPTVADFRKLTLLGAKTVAFRKSTFVIQVGCASSAEACRGTLTVSRSGKALFKKAIKVTAGRTTTVRVKPTKALRRKLAAGKSLSFVIDATGTSPTRSATTKRIRVAKP